MLAELGERQRYIDTLAALLVAQQQLEYWWHEERRCPCGARAERLDTHPHALGCPTERAVNHEADATEEAMTDQPDLPARIDALLARGNRKGTAVECSTCHNTKQPLGRSAPLGMYMCNQDCPGYMEAPEPDQLWPDESAEEFGYTREVQLIRALAPLALQSVAELYGALGRVPCRYVGPNTSCLEHLAERGDDICLRCAALHATEDRLGGRLG